MAQQKIELEVALKEVSAAAKTQGLNLSQSQSKNLQIFEKNAQLALQTGDLKDFKRNFNQMVKIIKDAASASSVINSSLKDVEKVKTSLEKTISDLKSSIATSKSKIDPKTGTLRVGAAKEFFKTNVDAQKIISSEGVKVTRQSLDDLVAKLNEALVKGTVALNKITNEQAQNLGFADRQSVWAANRYIQAENKYSTNLSSEIPINEEKLKKAEEELVNVNEEFNKIASTTPEASQALEQLFIKISDLGSKTNVQLDEQINAAKIQSGEISGGGGVSTLKAPDDINKSLQKQESSFGRTFKQISLYAIALRTAKKALQEAVKTVRDLDKYLTEQAMVTGKTRQETYGLLKSYQQLATQLGATTKDVAEVATQYMRQGKTTADALTLTEAAISAAKVAGISAAESVNYLTTALNGFQLAASDAMAVSDKFASIAAQSATSYEEIATALSKVASQANLAGMSIDYTTALLAKGIETTREAPETIGTALKTVIARMREISDYGETLSDGIDVNNVETQLGYVDIALRTTSGELRSTEDVLNDLGQKWDTLNSNQQAAIAKALAGTRQQSRLIAMMTDYQRVTELQQIAQRSAGATMSQLATSLEGMDAALNRVNVAWEKIVTNLINSDLIIGLVNTAASFLDMVADGIQQVWPMLPIFVLIGTKMLENVNIKVRENELQRIQNELVLEQQKEQNKLNLEQAKANALARKEAKIRENENNIQIKQAEAKLALDQGDTIKAKQLEAEIDLIKDQTEALKNQTDEETIRQDKHVQYYEKEAVLLNQEKDLIGGITSGWKGIGTAIGSFFGSAIPGLMKLIHQTNIAKDTEKALGKEAAAASGATVPVVGWIIWAVMVGSTVVSTVISLIQKFAKSIKNVEQVSEEAANQVYRTKTLISALDSGVKTYDNLDKKIIKTKNDIQAMNEALDQAADKLDETDKKEYNKLSTSAEKRKFLEDALNKQRDKLQDEYDAAIKRAGKGNITLYDASIIRSSYADKAYEVIDKTVPLEQQAQATEIIQTFVEGIDREDLLQYQNEIEDITKTILSSEDVLALRSEEPISKQVAAYRNLRTALGENSKEFKIFQQVYSEFGDWEKLGDGVINFAESLNLSSNAINDLWNSYDRLIAMGAFTQAEVTQEQFDELKKVWIQKIAEYNGDVLKATNETFKNIENINLVSFVETVDKIIGTTSSQIAQDVYSIKQLATGFYEKAMKWSELNEVEKMDLIQEFQLTDEDINAIKTQNFAAVEKILQNNKVLAERIKQQQLIIQNQLSLEEQKGDKADQGLIASYNDYLNYLKNKSGDLYKADLSIRLDAENKALDAYKDLLKKQNDALTDSLEKRKDAYQKYFDSINQQQEDVDYDERASILERNLAQLSTTTSGDAAKQARDLENQLKQLNKERLQTLKERAQEEIVKNIEDQVETINTNLEKLINNSAALLQQLKGEDTLELISKLMSTEITTQGLTELGLQDFLQSVQTTFGSVLGGVNWDNISATTQNNNLALNVNGTTYELSQDNQQDLYNTILNALTKLGLL